MGLNISHQDLMDNATRRLHTEALDGSAKAQVELGLHYELGEGVQQDYKEARRWFRRAAKQEYAAAQFNLGRIYADGLGVLQSDEMALRLYNQAAEQGYAPAQNSLGCIYRDGRGVPQDHIVAYIWFKRAAEGGDADGIIDLEALECKMTKDHIAELERKFISWKRRDRRIDIRNTIIHITLPFVLCFILIAFWGICFAACGQEHLGPDHYEFSKNAGEISRDCNDNGNCVVTYSEFSRFHQHVFEALGQFAFSSGGLAIVDGIMFLINLSIDPFIIIMATGLFLHMIGIKLPKLLDKGSWFYNMIDKFEEDFMIPVLWILGISIFGAFAFYGDWISSHMYIANLAYTYVKKNDWVLWLAQLTLLWPLTGFVMTWFQGADVD